MPYRTCGQTHENPNNNSYDKLHFQDFIRDFISFLEIRITCSIFVVFLLPIMNCGQRQENLPFLPILAEYLLFCYEFCLYALWLVVGWDSICWLVIDLPKQLIARGDRIKTKTHFWEAAFLEERNISNWNSTLYKLRHRKLS